MKKILKKPLIWSLLLLFFLGCNRTPDSIPIPDDCQAAGSLKAVNQDYLNQKEYYLARFKYDKIAENGEQETRFCPAHVLKGISKTRDENFSTPEGSSPLPKHTFYLIATLSYSCVRDMIESALSKYGDQENLENQNIVFGTFVFPDKDGLTKYGISIGEKIGNPRKKIPLAEAEFGDGIMINSEILSNQNIKTQLSSYQTVQDSLNQQGFYFNNMAILGINFLAEEDPFTKFQSQPIANNKNFEEVAPYVLSQLEKHFTNSPVSTDSPASTDNASPPIGKAIDIAICEILPKTQGLPASCGGINNNNNNNKYQVTFSRPTAVGHSDSDKIKAVVSDKNSGTMNGALDLSTVEGGSFLIADGKVLGIIPENPNAASTTLARGTTTPVPVDTQSTEELSRELLAKQGPGAPQGNGSGGLVINDNDPDWLKAIKTLSPLAQLLFTRQKNKDDFRRTEVAREETQRQIDTLEQSSGDDNSNNTELADLKALVDKQTLALENINSQIEKQNSKLRLLQGNTSDGTRSGSDQKKDCPDE